MMLDNLISKEALIDAVSEDALNIDHILNCIKNAVPVLKLQKLTLNNRPEADMPTLVLMRNKYGNIWWGFEIRSNTWWVNQVTNRDLYWVEYWAQLPWAEDLNI